MTTLIRNPRVREGLGNFVLISLSVGIVILYSSYQRPLWIDEVFHYAFGGFSGFASVLRLLRDSWLGSSGYWSAEPLNFILNYFTLQFFGASTVSFRLPSFVGAFLIAASAILLLRTRRYGFWWQALSLLAVAGSSFLMYYAGEGRPYMLLAGFVAATVPGFASALSASPPAGVQALLVIGCTGAILTHPYGVLYVVLLWLWSVVFIGAGKIRRHL